MSELRDFLEAAAGRFRTKTEFAKKIGITPGRFSRILKGEHSLDVKNCLTVAKLTGDPPSRVLRVAGKADIADLIESAYGPDAVRLSPTERDLVDAWNGLDERHRSMVRTLMGDLQSAPKKKVIKHTRATKTPHDDPNNHHGTAAELRTHRRLGQKKGR